MANYSVVEQAAALVEEQLDLLRLIHEDKKLLIDERSRIACRCHACRYENERTLAWLDGFNGEGAPSKAESPSSKAETTRQAKERNDAGAAL